MYSLLPIESHFLSGQITGISLAKDSQIADEIERIASKKAQAEHEKKARIARLQERDQMIPIRLVSGGLDDA